MNGEMQEDVWKTEDEWFRPWFNTPAYHLLYGHRSEEEAQQLVAALMASASAPYMAWVRAFLRSGRLMVSVRTRFSRVWVMWSVMERSAVGFPQGCAGSGAERQSLTVREGVWSPAQASTSLSMSALEGAEQSRASS